MSLAPESAPKGETLADPKALLRVPVGLASPLWPLFTGVAMSGAAWWWMTRWTRPANLEAMFGAMKTVGAETQAEVLALAQPLAEAADAVTQEIAEAVAEAEAAAEPVAEAFVEPVIEASPEPVLEALVDAPAALEAVGGESAPISPVLEAIAPEPLAPEAVEPTIEAADAPKARKKPATPKAD